MATSSMGVKVPQKWKKGTASTTLVELVSARKTPLTGPVGYLAAWARGFRYALCENFIVACLGCWVAVVFGRAKGDGNKEDRASRDLTADYFNEREGTNVRFDRKPSILAQHLIDSATKNTLSVNHSPANKSRLAFIHKLGGGHGWYDEIVGTVHSKGILSTTHSLKVRRLLRRQCNQTSLRSVRVTTASTGSC